eukprot:gene8284-10179_t
MADETLEIFEKDVFVFCGKPKDEDEREKLSDQISELGGVIARNANKKTTIALCNDYIENVDSIEKAIAMNIPVVKEDFVVESIKAKMRLNPNDFILENPNKRKDSDDGTNGASNGRSKKKVKLDHIQYGSVWCGTLRYTTPEEEFIPFFLNIESRQGDQIQGSLEWPTFDVNSKTTFKGTVNGDDVQWTEDDINSNTPTTTTTTTAASSSSSSQDTTMTADATSTNTPKQFKATFSFSSRDRKPQLKGSLEGVSGDSVNFTLSLTNRSCISVVIPPTLSTNGSLSTSSSTLAATTTITPPPPQHLAFLQDGKEFEGVLQQDFPFTFKVTHRRSPTDLEGTIDWVDLKTKTKLKGKIQNDVDVTFTEIELLQGDAVELPVEYTGKLSQNPLSSTNNNDYIVGAYKLQSGNEGKFTLQLI